jgi:hypothetical protein
MLRLLLGLCFDALSVLGRDLLLENLALRQQVLALKRRASRPRLSLLDRLFWIATKRLWSCRKGALVIVTPKTVVRWHRAGFRFYWQWRSRYLGIRGRKALAKETRDLIFRMVENPTWGAPRIHGEPMKLGFNLSERTVSPWARKAPKSPEPVQRWNRALPSRGESPL